MGNIIKSISRVVFEGALVFLLVTLIPGLPPHMNFTSFSAMPSKPLEGPLRLNGRLNNAEHLFEGELKGPECFAVHKGELYTGIHGGDVVKIVNGKVIPVIKFGKPCVGFWEEKICGRPLGMKFDKHGILYVADAYYGIFKVDIATGESTLLVSPSVAIDGKEPKLLNSIDIAKDGTMYWTDSSSEISLEDGVYTALGDGSGRLFRYDPKTNSSEMLLDNIHFANGVALSFDEEFVLVSETFMSRILRYHLKGTKKGQHDIFLDGLPGLPDNLKSNNRGGFYVPLVSARDPDHSIPFQAIGPYPIIRKFLARLLSLIELPFKQMQNIYPNYFTARIVHWIGHFESVSGLSLKRVSILEVDAEGKILDCLHSYDDTLGGISEVEVLNGYYYLGSPYNSYIGRVKQM